MQLACLQVYCSKSAAGLVAPDEGNVWPKGDPWCRRRDGLGNQAGCGRWEPGMVGTGTRLQAASLDGALGAT